MPTTALLQILVAAIPEAALRGLLLELVLGGAMVAAPLAGTAAETAAPAPATRRKGWPRGVPRGPRKSPPRTRAQLDALNAKRAAARAAARGAKQSPNGGNGSSTSDDGTAAAVWLHAAKLSPKAPWKALRELGINEALAQDACRWGKLPPGFGPAEAARFMELPVG